jgi:hypothetical protein
MKNVRCAIEDGLADAVWANSRLTELHKERQRLRGLANKPRKPPRIDGTALSGYMKELGRVLSKGTPAEQKRFIRMCVNKIELAPENLAVDMSFCFPEPVLKNKIELAPEDLAVYNSDHLPEPVMNELVAGAGFEPATFGL